VEPAKNRFLVFVFVSNLRSVILGKTSKNTGTLGTNGTLLNNQ
jgi:hypothetical protein